MKIFVSGGTGFIGSHFINSAISAGHKLVCLRRPKSRPRIKLNRNPNWVKGTLDDDFSKSMTGCDALVHMAACGVSPQEASKEDLNKVNVIESYKLIQSAISTGINKFLIIGTSDEFGNSGDRFNFLSPDAPLEPITGYAISKAKLFQLLKPLTAKERLILIYARIFSAYGMGQHEKNLWPSMKKAALSGEDYLLTPGEQIRSFIPVAKAVEKLVELLNFSEVKPGILSQKNISSDSYQTVREFSEHFWNKWNAKGKLHFGAKPYRNNEIMRCVPMIKDSE